MRVFVCIFAVLVIGVGVYADYEVTGKAQPVRLDDQTAAGLGDAPIPLVAVPANNCATVFPYGVLPDDAVYSMTGDTTGAGNDFEYDGTTHPATACTTDMGGGGQDEIWEFTVAANGYWMFGTCYDGDCHTYYSYYYYGYYYTGCWDSSLQITMNDGTCPGAEVACNGDGPGCPSYSSLIEDVFLTTGNTYYLIVDGWGSAPWSQGAYTVYFEMTQAACNGDPDCDDGLACNGAETCELSTGACLPGTPLVCLSYQQCIEPGGCTDPDPCHALVASNMSGYTGTGNVECQRRWKADDMQLDVHGNTRDLISYRYFHQARDYWEGDPLGATFEVETAIWLNRADQSCNPWLILGGTECTGFEAVIQTTGDDAMEMLCEPAGGLPTGVLLPNRAGDLDNCEVDFFISFRTMPESDWYAGQGLSIASDGIEYVGGPGATDEFGVNVVWYENCDLDEVPDGTFGASWFGDDVAIAADFGDAYVCTVPNGGCAGPGRATGCEVMTEEACATAGGLFLGSLTMGDQEGCDDEDPDDDDYFGGADNCFDVYNPDQLDCNSDGEGDACEPPEQQDDDGDGFCNEDENCPDDPLKQEPGQCGCGNPDTDTDYDGTADCNDLCPLHPLWALVMPGCGCESDEYDNENDDGDGFLNCDDTCAGVDDAEFGPCDEAIPTVSEWGLVIMALLLLAAGKVYFSRRPEVG